MPSTSGRCEVVKGLAVGGEPDLRAAAVEQGGLEFLLQRLDLERNRGLAQRGELGRLGDAAVLGRQAEAAKIVQPVVPAFRAGGAPPHLHPLG